jgi:hypothetical protein
MSRPLRIVAFLAVLAAGVLASMAIRQSMSPASKRVAEPPPADPAGDVVARALDIARGDSTHKEQWVDEIPDLELAALPGPARETFLRIANGRRCDCGCGYTLAACRRFDSTCDVSGPRARALFDSVRTGQLSDAGGFRERPAAD